MGIKSRIQRQEQAPETASAPATETASAPATETASAPATETASAPATETASAPATETASAPATETASAPATETASAPAPEPEKKKTTAPPPARKEQAGALSVAGNVSSLVALKDAIDPSEFGYGDVPRIVANNNMIYGPDKMKLGTWIDVQVLSHSSRWMISPGSDDDDASSLVRASYDGETILHNGEDNGKAIDEYLKELKEAGYDKAVVKEYADIFCLLIGAENTDNGTLLAQEGMLNISLSPMSKGKFNAYAKQLKLTVMRGAIAAEKAQIVRFKTSLKSANNRDFTLLVPTTPPREVSDAAFLVDLSD